MQITALTALIYRISQSEFLLGAITFCAFIPILPLSTFAGTLIDRIDKRKALLITQSLALIQAFIFAFLAFTDLIQIWHMLVLSLALGIVAAFDMPLRQASLIELVGDKSMIPNAIALNSLQFNVARVIGPTIAGFVIVFFNEAWCFLLNGLSYLTILYAILKIDWQKPIQEEKGKNIRKKSLLENWQDGFAYIRHNQPIYTLLIIISVVALSIGSYSAIVPALAKHLFNGQADIQSAILAFAGMGAIIGNIWLANFKSPFNLTYVIGGMIAAASIALILLGQTRSLIWGLPLVSIVGAGIIMTAASVNSLLQMLVANERRGQVMSFYIAGFTGLYPLGALMAGFLSEKIGVPLTLVILGCIGLLNVIFYASIFKKVAAQIKYSFSSNLNI
ncbi:MFS transporter [Gammaproteobacteria bacterium]|nr:MFS transporter [Gammaproteobacteria bacterium]